MNTDKKIARITGVLYLIIFFANIFAFMFVTNTLRVPDDAAATANNIVASEGLYRSGIVSYLIVFLSDIGVAVLLYNLLKSVNPTIALIAMVTRLIQTAVHGVNLINLIFPLLLLNDIGYLTVFEPAQLQASALLFLDVHHYGVLVSEAFFAVSTLLLGYLVFKSDYFPRILGIFLVLAALGYILDSFGIFLMPQYETLFAEIMVLPAVVGEMSFTLYLLIKGVRSPKLENSVSLKTISAKGVAG